MTTMNVVIFGASGRTGRLLVEGALALGHSVTVLVPQAGQTAALADEARLVQGDILDGGAVSDAVDGQDAAFVTLFDAGVKSERQAIAEGTLNVVRSMQRYGLRRLIVLSSSLAHPSRDPNLSWFRERLIKPILHKDLAATMRRTEVIVRQSELDWTIVRVTSLTDGRPAGRYRVGPGFSLVGDTSIARGDVAAFMLDELGRRQNIAHAVALAN